MKKSTNLARVTISMDGELWDQFIQKLYEENGKTHGGVISKTIRGLIKKHYLGVEKND